MKNVAMILSFALVMALSISARAGEFPMAEVDYQADQLMQVKSAEGNFNMKGKIYHSGKKERREHNFEGHHGVMILRMDKNVSWMLMPRQKMYMEHALNEARPEQGRKDASVDWVTAQDVRMEKVGTERIGGYETTKYKVTVKESDGTTGSGTVWLTEHNIPIKMQGTSHSNGEEVQMQMELKNLKIGEVDDDLFEVPGDYQKMGMPGMMGPGTGRGKQMKGNRMGPGMGMPEGMPGPGASPEEMEAFKKKMMEQAEQMRKQMQEGR